MLSNLLHTAARVYLQFDRQNLQPICGYHRSILADIPSTFVPCGGPPPLISKSFVIRLPFSVGRRRTNSSSMEIKGAVNDRRESKRSSLSGGSRDIGSRWKHRRRHGRNHHL